MVRRRLNNQKALQDFLAGILSIKRARSVATLPFWRESQMWEFYLSCVMHDSLLILCSATCDVLYIAATYRYDLFIMLQLTVAIFVYIHNSQSEYVLSLGQ